MEHDRNREKSCEDKEVQENDIRLLLREDESRNGGDLLPAGFAMRRCSPRASRGNSSRPTVSYWYVDGRTDA